MHLDDYQHQAQATDRVPQRENKAPGDDFMVPLLGLAGETGELLSEYKKHLRDGSAHILFPERIAEELGDILWYTANIASKFNLSLSEIATRNLRKTRDRWTSDISKARLLDEDDPLNEQFPRRFLVEMFEVESNSQKKIRLRVDGQPFGDDLTDNSYDPDGYRFHDVFHFGYVAVLGWSPVIRKLMGKKRRSNKVKDEVEDGGRAQVVDEGISALVFEYARQHSWLAGVRDIDYHLLRTIQGITNHLQVGAKSMQDWQMAVLAGFDVWRQVKASNGGRIEVDLQRRQLTFLGPASPHS